MALTTELESARRAYDAGAWATSYEQMAEADLTADLSTEDLFRYATAAGLLGRHEESLRALQRGFTAAEDQDDDETATRLAAWLALVCLNTGRAAVAGGWLGRGQVRAVNLPTDCAAVALLRIPLGMAQLFSGHPDEASASFEQVLLIGTAHHDDDLTGFAHHALGRTALVQGRVSEGLQLLDQAMTTVLTGRMNPVLAGVVYCSLIEGCQQVGDLDRARQWTAALSRWCEQQPDLVAFTGQCSVHRAQIMALDGSFRAALEELGLARRRYELLPEQSASGEAWYEEGEVHRLLGDYDGAVRCYLCAGDIGRDPQPGLALLSLAQGEADRALVALTRASAETDDDAGRTRLLPALVEVALAAGDLNTARRAADELTGLAERFQVRALLARSAQARGQMAMASGDPSAALRAFRVAHHTWDRMAAPYGAATARMWSGQACRALGDEDAARSELESARAAFEIMGTGPAEARCRSLLAPAQRLPGGLSAREVEVLRLVAAGRTNREIARELYLSEKTVARHLSNIFTKIDVHTRTAAAGYAHEHHLL